MKSPELSQEIIIRHQFSDGNIKEQSKDIIVPQTEEINTFLTVLKQLLTQPPLS